MRAVAAKLRRFMIRAFSVLRYRDYTVYAAARFCTSLAWEMLGVAVGWQVYQLTRNPLYLGFVGLAQFLPFVLLVLPAGHVADRADRRLVLVSAYSVQGVCAGVLLAFTLSGSMRVWPVYVAMTLFGAARAFSMPASQAMTPNLVPPEVFPKAVAFNSVLLEIATIVGPSLGGVLYLLGPQVVYSVGFGLVIVVVSLISTIKPVRATVATGDSNEGDLLGGLRFVMNRPVVLGAISLDLFAVLFGGATALLPAFASDILHIGPAGLGTLRTAPGIGAALTALAVGIAPIERHVGRWMLGGVALFGASNELGEFESGVTARWFGLVRAAVLGGIATLIVVTVYLRLFPQLRSMDRFKKPA